MPDFSVTVKESNFKRKVWINDFYGFMAGDSAIKKVASKLNELSESKKAQTFRISGDEFLILLSDSTSHNEALGFAKEIIKRG